MEGACKKEEVGYLAAPDFKEDNKESLINIQMDEDTELWLLQLPDDKIPDFDGQNISLELDRDGHLGTIQENPGKVYDMVSYPAETADITVFLSSPSGPKVAGKISRHVSLVHYPDPKELLALESEKNSRTPFKASRSSSLTASRSQKTPYSQSRSQATHSSGKRSARSELTDVSARSKRSEYSRFSNHSAQESGRGRSDVTFSGSSELSHRKKSKSKTSTQS